MKKLMIIGVLIVAATSYSCKSYCGRSCVNRYSSVTPKDEVKELPDYTENTTYDETMQ